MLQYFHWRRDNLSIRVRKYYLTHKNLPTYRIMAFLLTKDMCKMFWGQWITITIFSSLVSCHSLAVQRGVIKFHVRYLLQMMCIFSNPCQWSQYFIEYSIGHQVLYEIHNKIRHNVCVFGVSCHIIQITVIFIEPMIPVQQLHQGVRERMYQFYHKN